MATQCFDNAPIGSVASGVAAGDPRGLLGVLCGTERHVVTGAAGLQEASKQDLTLRLVGAGGGFEYNGEPGTPLPGSGYAARLSGNFSVFDPTGTLSEASMTRAR